MKPSCDFSPKTSLNASVTNFTTLSTACVWYENFGKNIVGITCIAMNCRRSVFVIVSITGSSVITMSVQSTNLKYSVASKLSLAGTWNFCICPLTDSDPSFHHSLQTQFLYMCRWSVVIAKITFSE